MRLAVLIAAALTLAACSRQPGFYTPSAVRPAFAAPSSRPSHFVAMSSPDAARNVLSGVVLNGDGPWRWCLKEAQLQFDVPRMRGLKFKTEIAVGESTFVQTGPVRITISVEGHAIGDITFEKSDNRIVEFDVPESTLPATGLVHVTLAADKQSIPTDGGDRRAFILTSAGFVQ
jgi:hypothetical protein